MKHQSFDISGMLQLRIRNADETADERECQDTDAIATSFASART
jgi:hypothetical protein